MSSLEHVDIKTTSHPERATMAGQNKFLGFWFFLGGETVLFGTLFATFLALRNKVALGPSSQELFSLPLTFLSTMFLLTSSLTSVFAILAMKDHKVNKMRLWFWVTVLLGACLLGCEVFEFHEYLGEHLGFTTSPFSSSFYFLVGTHGCHVFFGLLWISALVIQSYKKGITTITAPKYYVAALYWHFIDVVWVFIFTIVYLLGMLGG